ncbi:hypothetical protein NLU13_1070 [Sarocladium strictum]|uniref:lytic cellulose monooxygenase (C4-dehydrogenating) n=1 Tax=Sarocladium strictum TaxID=5046 RepID=A0AA39GQ93_SARSR|nr:hypothetical protein NLU13_1070 [Sarocladium strictum]
MSFCGVIILLGLAAQAIAHGYVATYTVNGVDFEGFRRLDAPPIPNSVGWSFSTPDEGSVLDISSPDMVCRHDGMAGPASAPISAGQVVDFHWTSADLEHNPDGWSQGHRGPVITYLAPCNGPCDQVDKTTLRWVKIAEAGLISGLANREGVWATDLLRQGNNSAMIPTSIAPGNYVIRNEIIATHRSNLLEPEFYMACANIEVTSGGNDDLSGKGVVATELYSREDKQLFGFSIYESTDPTWPIPGPPLYQGASRGDVPDSNNNGRPIATPTNPEPTPKIEPAPTDNPYLGPCGRAWRA